MPAERLSPAAAGAGCNLLVVLGPTASGKTRLGVELARRLAGEIISADSRQVYRGMDLGTGKDLHEYGEIPYHLIDILPPGSEFNLFEFQQRFVAAFAEIAGRGRLPVLVGGTGLYLDSILSGYRLRAVPEDPAWRLELEPLEMSELCERLKASNPKLHNSTDLTERQRVIRALEIARCQEAPQEAGPEIRPFALGIRWPREALRQRITARLKERLQEGMIEEARRLVAQGTGYERLEFYGLEYRYLARHLKGELNRNDLFQQLNAAIHQFAKKQETWFRNMEKRGVRIHWIDGAGDTVAQAEELLRGSGFALGV